ncbi:MAG: hypothetical protein HYU97_07190 [Deltaproteobacteria bacterium]|nr:hypothetical protein [Deltaproteobacteria bacterium]
MPTQLGFFEGQVEKILPTLSIIAEIEPAPGNGILAKIIEAILVANFPIFFQFDCCSNSAVIAIARSL